MLNQEEIKNVANESNTSKIVFEKLSQRQRFRRSTNLNQFQNQLLNAGEKIVEDEYMETFRNLQKLGIGSLIHGRGNKPTRFKWNYDLKGVAKAAQSSETVEIPELSQKKQYKTAEKRAKTPKVERNASTIEITLRISSKSKPEDIAALLELAKQLQ